MAAAMTAAVVAVAISATATATATATAHGCGHGYGCGCVMATAVTTVVMLAAIPITCFVVPSWSRCLMIELLTGTALELPVVAPRSGCDAGCWAGCAIRTCAVTPKPTCPK